MKLIRVVHNFFSSESSPRRRGLAGCFACTACKRGRALMQFYVLQARQEQGPALLCSLILCTGKQMSLFEAGFGTLTRNLFIWQGNTWKLMQESCQTSLLTLACRTCSLVQWIGICHTASLILR